MNWPWFFFGLIGILAHILFKMRDKGKERFVFVWQYIKDNQITMALSVFTYLAVFLLWNNGFLSKLFQHPLFEIRFTYGTVIIAYFSDSIWRNFVKNVGSVLERKRNH